MRIRISYTSLSVFIGILAFLSATLGAIKLVTYNEANAFSWAMALLTTASALFLIALWLRRDKDDAPLNPVFPDEAPLEAPLRRIHYAAIVVGIGLLLLVGEANSHLLFPKPNLILLREHMQFSLFIAGTILLAWGFSGGWRLPQMEWQEIGAVVLLTLFALWLRWANLNNLIPIYIDSAHSTNVIPVFDWNGPEPVYLFQIINGLSPFPRMYVYWQWIATSIFGRNIGGLMMVSGIFGALAVPGIYLLAKQLFNRPTAFIAAGLLATLPLQIHFSRVPVLNIGDPTAALFMFAFFLRGLRCGGRANFVLAGVALGWTQFFHEAGRITFPPMMLLWLVIMLLIAWRVHWRSLLKRLAITLFCGLAVAWPFYITLYSQHVSFFSRVENVGLRNTGWTDLIQSLTSGLSRIWPNLEVIVYQTKEKIFFIPGTPYIMSFITLFVFLGIAYLVWHWRKPASSLLALWIVIPLAGITLFLPDLHSPRVQPFLPALMLLAAVGIERFAVVVLPRPSRGIVIAAGVTVICVIQVITYFSSYAPAFVRMIFEKEPWTMVMPDVSQLPPDAMIHIVSGNHIPEGYAADMIKFVSSGKMQFVPHKPDSITAATLIMLDRSRSHVFFIQQPNPDAMALIKQYYPDAIDAGIFTDERSPFWFAKFIIPKS